jgi:hypothetical protein
MILGWFTKPLRDEISRLQADIERRKVSYVKREGENWQLRKELQLQRVLIDALRNVNASLDARCNDLERGQ